MQFALPLAKFDLVLVEMFKAHLDLVLAKVSLMTANTDCLGRFVMQQVMPHRRCLVDSPVPPRRVVNLQSRLHTSAAAMFLVRLHRPRRTVHIIAATSLTACICPQGHQC